MAKEEKNQKTVLKYTEADYQKALTDLDEVKEDDFFGRKSMTETGSSVTAIIKAIVYIVFIVVVSFALAYFAIVWVNDAFAFVKDDKDIEITIPDGVTSAELADILGENEVIDYPYVFKLFSKVKKVDKKTETYKFEAGTYTVNSNMNYDNLLRSFHSVTVVEEFKLTIPEGYTVDEIIALFMDKGIGTKEGWTKAINEVDYSDSFPYLADIPDDPDRIYKLEGYLFPNSYRFYTGQDESYYIKKILSEGFDVFVYQKIKDDLANTQYTLDEILIIASIVEKEAYYVRDFYGISMVIQNRLNNAAKYPRLECDSTLIYYLSHKAGQKVTTLSATDLTDDTNPYNTYVFDGMLHGPICNPSFNGISAVFEPDKEEHSKDYYFVTDAGKEALYARTLKEHQENVKKIRGN